MYCKKAILIDDFNWNDLIREIDEYYKNRENPDAIVFTHDAYVEFLKSEHSYHITSKFNCNTSIWNKEFYIDGIRCYVAEP